jgi:hypothetical protein
MCVSTETPLQKKSMLHAPRRERQANDPSETCFVLELLLQRASVGLFDVLC